MTFLLFQAFLLMAAAYFLGAFLGCWWRRAVHAPVEVSEIGSGRDALATAGAVAGAGTINVPRSDPIPVQPRIEYVDTHESIADRSRFERALSGVGSLETQGQEQFSDAASQVEQQPPHFAVEPRPAPTEYPAETSAARDPHEPSATEPAPAATQVTDDAVAAAAAAAAAAMAVVARQRLPVSEPPPSNVYEVEAPRPAIPVAAAGGMAGVAADVRVPPLMPADGQDLKLVAGIDADIERTLNSLGVWRYSDIARWTHGDVASINRSLGAHARVQRENWIEQAAVLSKGGLTAFARRRLRGEMVEARPTDTARPPHGPISTMPMSSAVEPAQPLAMRSPAAMATAAAAGVAAAAASASRGRAASTSHRPPAPVRAPRPAITEIGEPHGTQHEPEDVSIAVVAPAFVPPAPAAVAPPARAMPDQLQRIRGIDPSAERLLHDNSVTRYEEIAGWTAIEVEYFDELMEQPGRISRENWIEQAQVLARGSSTLFARQRDAGSSAAVGSAAAIAAAAASAAAPASTEPRTPRPSRLADAMRMNQERAPSTETTTPEHQAAPQPESQHQPNAARSDVASLRSVRSEALRSDRFGGRADVVDDLKRIRGVGVLIEKKLNSLGIASYDQIANWTAADIAHISEVLDFRGRIERENWIEQARILCAGGHTEFSRRIDRGDGA